MLKKTCGKLSVYASHLELQGKRVRSVKMAAKRLAEFLNLDVEVVPFREKTPLIYVYYSNGGDDPVPLYCERQKIRCGRNLCGVKEHDVCAFFSSEESSLKKTDGERNYTAFLNLMVWFSSFIS